MREPLLYLELPVLDPDIRCPECNGACVTSSENWTSNCTECSWSTDYEDPEDAFLVTCFDIDLAFLEPDFD